MDITILQGSVVHEWQARGAVLDSAFRTQGGIYEWSYHGLANAH